MLYVLNVIANFVFISKMWMTFLIRYESVQDFYMHLHNLHSRYVYMYLMLVQLLYIVRNVDDCIKFCFGLKWFLYA